MQHVKRSRSGYAHNLHYVLLDTIDHTYSDARLITMADRHGELTDAEWTDIEAYDGADGGSHPGHFGGVVTRMPGKKNKDNCYAVIKVYTD